MFYLYCQNIGIRNNFLYTQYCFFKGYPIKFFKWEPNFSEDGISNAKIPIWISIKSVSPELNNLEILKKIGSSIGDLIGIEKNHSQSKNIKLIVNSELNKQ